MRYDWNINNIENVWIKILEMIIGVIYKPPSFSNLDFLDALEVNLCSIHLSKRNV